MRKEAELIPEKPDVDVHTRAVKAARRNGVPADLSEPLKMPEIFNAQGWLARLLPHGERLMVNGRTVQGFVLPHWAAGVLLAAILSGMGFMWRSFSTEQQAQRDMLIEIKTEMRIYKENEVEFRSKTESDLKLQKAYIDNITGQYNTIKGLLTPQQLRYLQSHVKENAHVKRR